MVQPYSLDLVLALAYLHFSAYLSMSPLITYVEPLLLLI